MASLGPLAFAGPSGSGKSTLITRLTQEFPGVFGFSVSHTTRDPRPGEKDGVHYHFVPLEQMKKDEEAGKFIETARVHGQMYGTSFSAYEAVRAKGQHCIFDIDMQGCETIAKTDLKPHYVWIQAKDLSELERRLTKRGEAPDRIRRRLATAKAEMDWFQANKSLFHTVVVNEDVDRAYADLKAGIAAYLPEKK